MDRKYKTSLVLAALSCALMACTSNTVKEDKTKPSALPKIEQSISLAPVFSQRVSSTKAADPLRLRMSVDRGIYYLLDPKGSVLAYKGKQRLWERRVSKLGLSSGIEAANGLVIVGNKKGQVFALGQASGQVKWQAQLTGAVISPALIQSNRVVVVANDGTVFGLDEKTGQTVWTYRMPVEQLSLRGQAAPVRLDARTVLVASSNAYLYAIDSLTGNLRMQRRVAVSDGRSDIQRLVDIDGEPAVAGQFVVTSSYQGQVTVLDLASQRVVWSEDASSITRPEVAGRQVFVSHTDGTLASYDLLTGKEIWRNSLLLYRQLSNPVILGRNLVVGDYAGVLHIVDPATGKLVGREKSSGAVRSLRVIDNQLFAATQSGALTIWQNR